LPESAAREPCGIVGFARSDWSDDKFREEMRAAVSESACKLIHWEELARRMYYVRGNFDDDAGSSYAALRGAVRDELGIPEHVLMQLSTPPGFYGTIAERLGAAALAQSENGWRRVIIEKPFGQDAKSAMKLEGDVS
jgi:glucose-6-phosphate 1-dehydrogenase